ncbi:leucine-rich repeat extensin-like protein 3 [Stylophora pistillata]|uniref:leucine-rich repeat extensin-like protein 3 n=1 Tax=Stylophora pistillata TaxID=50429 RepID=UPI000C052AFA|nr:leucine-rich repeat extensin-like protein 3 [Stylophora pistillata]
MRNLYFCVPTNGTGSHAAPPSPPLTPSSPASISPPPSPSTLPPAPSPAPPPYNYPKPPVSPATAPSPASPPASPPSSQGITPSSPPIPNGEQEPKALHYHYHYHGQKAPAIPSAVCPNMCSQSEECLPTCPSHCCKRDLDEEISDDNDEEDITLF